MQPSRDRPVVSAMKRVSTTLASPWSIALVFVLAVGQIRAGWLSSTADFMLWARDALFNDNLHEVVPGELFRSAQTSHDRLAELIRANSIATVIDLRNGKPDPDDRGLTEADIVASEGATYEHVPLLTSNLPSKQRLLHLLDVFDRAPRPVLIHCSSGALRTGVASALWLMAEDDVPPAVAAQQLRIRFGYLPWESDFRRWQLGFDPLVTLLDDYAAARRQGAIDLRDWVQAGTQAANFAGVVRFYPPAIAPGHS